MKEYEHVYCTKCKNLIFNGEELPYCPYHKKCDNWDFEDSRPFKDRPMYIPINLSIGGRGNI